MLLPRIKQYKCIKIGVLHKSVGFGAYKYLKALFQKSKAFNCQKESFIQANNVALHKTSMWQRIIIVNNFLHQKSHTLANSKDATCVSIKEEAIDSCYAQRST